MKRLFSNFAHGWPGAGLILLRLAAGMALIAPGITELSSAPPLEATILNAAALAGGILLVLGLWTPLAGSAVAMLELWDVVSQPGDPWTRILLLAIGGALAMLGPGALSIDARLFGWKRLNFRDRAR